MEKWKNMTFTGLSVLVLAACGNSTNPPAPEESASAPSAESVFPEGEGGGTAQSSDSTSESHSESAAGTDSNSAADTSSTNANTSDPLADSITLSEAVKVFHGRYPDAKIQEVDFDKDWGDWTYEITGDFENREYEMEINAKTSEIIDVQEEDMDDDEGYLNFDLLIDPAEAVDKARQEVGEDATLEGWNLEMDDRTGNPEYEVEFEGTVDRDVTIHAETGETIEVDD